MENKTDEKIIENKKKVTINGWKIAFIVLACTLIGGSLVLLSRLTQEREDIPALVGNPFEPSGAPLVTLQSQKEQINKIAAVYLDSLQADSKNQSDQNYQFILKNEALITGKFDLLGFPMNFYPFVMDDGNIQLKAKSLSVGLLDLPINQVLKMIAKASKLPEWIEVNAKNEMIILHLNQLELKNGLYVQAKTINLVEDKIEFKLYLAEEKIKDKKEDENSKE